MYYSVLYFRQNLNDCYSVIENQLKEGTKVIWFGKKDECKRLKESFESFCDALLLQVYPIDQSISYKPVTICDGKIEDNIEIIDYIEKNIPAFNTSQYLIEHCASDKNIIVKASAGTGKTTVMIDRILYLLHTQPSVKLSDIYMITFTNEATNQMNNRLQEVLLKRYALTKKNLYLTWLEQQSQMSVSTIDSLAYELFKRFGVSVGFGRDLEIKPLEKERKETLKDILSDNLRSEYTIYSQLMMSYSEASKLIDAYWRELTRKGYTIKEILNKDWGKENDPVIANISKVFKAVLDKFENEYRAVKLDNNAISIDDLFFDFGHYLLDDVIDCTGLNMKYLFVDEFQDTDATQIRTFARLSKAIKARLFVVGDTKQSIYSFKGATDEAFNILSEELDADVVSYSLVNNYRTCENIMTAMEKYFYKWAEEDLLEYTESVRPFNKKNGSIKMHLQARKNERSDQIATVISNALFDLEMDVKAGRKKVTDKTKVAVLVRGNNKAMEIADICRNEGLSVVLNSDRPFYLSRAVRDFYAFISSFIFIDSPKYIYNFLQTPYAKFEGLLSIEELEKYNGDNTLINEYLSKFVSQTNWFEYQRDFRLYPVMSVIKKVVEDASIFENYIAQEKGKLIGDKWTDAGRNREVLNRVKQYKANLDKLMEILQRNMEGEFSTLYDIYVYLTLMIATNRDDKEPDIESKDDYMSVYIMTVHKSKGLEFDTVVMPAMGSNIYPWENSTILVNEEKVAWFYKKNASASINSSNYEELRNELIEKGKREETRLLYVAMTRAINNLILIVNDNSMYESWSTLIRRVGLIDV